MFVALSQLAGDLTITISTMSSHGSTASGPTAGKPTVAPPALNVYKKVAVIRKPSDSLTYEDAEGNIKSVSAQELGDAIAHAVRGEYFFWYNSFFNANRSSY